MAIRHAPAPTIQASGAYQVVPAAGGAWHVYPNGRKVFVKAGAAAPVEAPEAPAPVEAPAPAAEAAPAAPAPVDITQISPDSTYYTTVAQQRAKRDQDLASNTEQATRNKNALDVALTQMRQQQPRDEQVSRLNANRQGLYYSSTLGNQLNDLAAKYAESRSKTQSSFDESERARVAARAAIEQGATMDEAAALAASYDRQLGRDTQAADTGSLVRETADFTPLGLPAPVKEAAAPVVASKAFKTIVKRDKVYHVYPNRAPVYVRPASRKASRKPRRR